MASPIVVQSQAQSQSLLIKNDFVVNIEDFPKIRGANIGYTLTSEDISFSCDCVWTFNIQKLNGQYNMFLTFKGIKSVKAKIRMEVLFDNYRWWDAVIPFDFFTWSHDDHSENPSLTACKIKSAGTELVMNNNTLATTQRILIKVYIEIKKPSEVIADTSNSNLSANLVKYISDCTTEFSDVSVICADDTRIPAHKLILASQSDVFKAMLTTNMTESNTNEIMITDFEPDVVKAFIQHLYTDNLTNSVNTHLLMEVFKMAHKYEVTSLLNACERSFLLSINMNNAVNFLLLSHTYSLDGLKQRCIEFIAKNYAVMSTIANFETLSSSLLLDIMMYMSSYVK